jgi:hypothetical protein
MTALTMAVLLAIIDPLSVAYSFQNRPIASHPAHTLVRLSCSPRKTCTRTVESCEEAYWLMENCSWGGKLDGDNDGVPCENMCSGG